MKHTPSIGSMYDLHLTLFLANIKPALIHVTFALHHFFCLFLPVLPHIISRSPSDRPLSPLPPTGVVLAPG